MSSDVDQDIQGRIEWRGEGDGRDGGGSGRHLSRPVAVLSASASVQCPALGTVYDTPRLCHFTPYSTAKLNELSRKTIICLIKSLNLWKCNFSPTGLIQHTCK